MQYMLIAALLTLGRPALTSDCLAWGTKTLNYHGMVHADPNQLKYMVSVLRNGSTVSFDPCA